MPNYLHSEWFLFLQYFSLKSEPLGLCTLFPIFWPCTSVKRLALLLDYIPIGIGMLSLGSLTIETSSLVWRSPIPSPSPQRTHASVFDYFGGPPLKTFESTHVSLALGKGDVECPHLDTIIQVWWVLRDRRIKHFHQHANTAQDAVGSTAARVHCKIIS